MDASYMEVEFGKYCGTCKYAENSGTEQPCLSCISHPMMYGTRKPKNYVERTNFRSYSETRRSRKLKEDKDHGRS